MNPNLPITKTELRYCKHCNAPFSTNNPQKRYCNHSCRQMHYQSKVDASGLLNGIGSVNASTHTLTQETPQAQTISVTPAPKFEPSNYTNNHSLQAELLAAKLEAVETRHTMAIERERHKFEIEKLQAKIKELEEKGAVDTTMVMTGLSSMIGAMDQDAINTILRKGKK